MSLRDEFRDRAYRRAYAESLANTVIATQIRLLRGELTQQQFAEKVGMKQSRVSAMEDENYSKWSTRILKQVADGCDVVYLGHFISFGELLRWSEKIGEDSLHVSSFANDRAFQETDAPLAAAHSASAMMAVVQRHTKATNFRVITGGTPPRQRDLLSSSALVLSPVAAAPDVLPTRQSPADTAANLVIAPQLNTWSRDDARNIDTRTG